MTDKSKKPSTNPRAKSARQKRARKKGQAAENRANEQRGGEQLKPEEIWPNYPQMESTTVDLTTPFLNLNWPKTGALIKAVWDFGNATRRLR